MTEVVRLSNISKSFGPVQALENVNLSLFAGQVHALIGENGAGKSTLMKILSGTYPAGEYGGEILLNGSALHLVNPKAAEKAGIAIIHQELSAFPHLTVAENLFVGHWQNTNSLIQWNLLREEAQKWLDLIGAGFSADAIMGELSTGNQQLVEIAKAVSRQTQVLIFDEPTSSLTPRESEKLFAVIQQLKVQEKTLVYISHRMEEIYRLCERATVLRDGRSVFTSELKDVTEAILISNMVGRSLDRLFPKVPDRRLDTVVLEAQDFTAISLKSGKKFGPINFKLKKGEILGFSGLLGAGRSELLRAMLGDQDFETSGKVQFASQAKDSAKVEEVHWSSPVSAFRSKIGWVSEDRKRESLLPQRSLTENTGVLRLSLAGVMKLISNPQENQTTEVDLKKLNTRFGDTEQSISELSGGNQQKVIFSRILQNNPEIIVLDEPTRGVDVGAKFEIYQILIDLVLQGKSILLISSDLPELMALSDRVIVLSDGVQTGELSKSEINQDCIMQLAIQH